MPMFPRHKLQKMLTHLFVCTLFLNISLLVKSFVVHNDAIFRNRTACCCKVSDYYFDLRIHLLLLRKESINSFKWNLIAAVSNKVPATIAMTLATEESTTAGNVI